MHLNKKISVLMKYMNDWIQSPNMT